MNVSRIKAIARRPVFVAATILIALSAVLVAVEWYGPIPQPGPALEGKLTEVQQNAISLIVDLAKLFMGWSLAVIGGAGYFLKANIERDYPLSKLDLSLAEAVILASIVSIFYGHLTINFIVTMLTLEVLNLADPALVWYIRVQYVAFLMSLLLFGAYIHSTFFQRAKPTRSFPESTEKGCHE
jgi:hypothetical protein